MTEAIRVRIALAATVCSWAGAFVFIRVGAQEYPVGGFLFIRFLAPAVLLGALAARSGALVPPRGDRRAVLVLGLLFAAYLALLIAGEQTVDAGTASMLAETSPILAAVLAAIFLGERASRLLFVGLGISFAGTALIALSGEEGFEPSAGVLLVLAAAVAQAALLVVQRPLLKRQPAVHVVAQASVVGAVLMLPFAGQAVEGVRDARVEATLSIIALAITAGAISYVTLAYALARSALTGAVTAVLYLVPPATIVVGWITLGESPAPLSMMGGAVAVVGVVVATWRPAAAGPAIVDRAAEGMAEWDAPAANR